jgi:uncharacterized membrane protein (UPF0136 family)
VQLIYLATNISLKGSKASLIAGLGVGTLYGVSGYLLHQNADYGIELALLSSALLTGGMLPRAIRVGKPLPVSLVILGAVNCAYFGRKWFEFNQ